jgi:hypothetical protein
MGTILTGLILLGIVTAVIFKIRRDKKKNAPDVPAGAGNPVQKRCINWKGREKSAEPRLGWGSGIKHGILIVCIIVILCVIGVYRLALLQGEFILIS